MIHLVGKYLGANRTIEGDLSVSFVVDDETAIETLKSLSEVDLAMDIEKYYSKRSDRANRYFWKLCGEIGAKLGNSKDVIYLMQLQKYGRFDNYSIIREAIPTIRNVYKFVEEIDSWHTYREDSEGEMRPVEMVNINCYWGSHTYNTQEMSRLINGTVNDAKDLGISTWTEDEIKEALSVWGK